MKDRYRCCVCNQETDCFVVLSRWGFSTKVVEMYRDEDLNGEEKWCIDWENNKVHEVSGSRVCLDICLHQYVQAEMIEAEAAAERDD
jgi:hypothetical protein